MKKVILALGLLSSTALFAADKVLTPPFHGKLFLKFRPRWEYVDVANNGLKTANAGTARFQLGQLIKATPALKFYWEVTAVTLFYDHYAPEKKGYEFVADEDGLRITQLYAEYRWKFLDTKIGRQVINIDNQRFIGAVNWRQMPQTFDAARVDVSPLKKVDLTAIYLVSRQGVLDKLSTDPFEDEPFNHSVLLHIGLKPYKGVNAALYSYNLKKNSDTYGVNVHGNIPFRGFKLNYWGEYAYQIVHNGKVWDTANYYHLEGGASYKWEAFTPFATLGYEHFDQHFITPLATLHKFNGWADVFLKYTATTDTYGLNDAYATLGVKNKKFGKFLATYHYFTPDKDFPQGGDKFGDEVDLLWTKKLKKNISVLVKFAKYNADDDAKQAGVGDKDTTKFWVMLNFAFGTSF